MLAPILSFKKVVVGGLLFVAALSIISCATDKKQVTLVNDPDARGDSPLPWNKQESLEQGSAMGGMVNSDHAH